MTQNEEHTSYFWLEKSFRRSVCPECSGKGCSLCKNSGLGSLVFSRTEAIRSKQKVNGHASCFGMFHNLQRTSLPCRKLECNYLTPCKGLCRSNKFDGDRLREESIEILSKVYLNARAIERPRADWTPLQAEIAGVIQQWNNDTPQVAVIGAFSSGKSTLLNCLLGCKLPSSRTPTTAVVTTIRYGKQPMGVLHFRDFTRIPLVSSDAKKPDLSMIRALRNWLRQPVEFGIDQIVELSKNEDRIAIDLSSLLQQLDDLLAEKSQEPQTGLRRMIHGKHGYPELRLDHTFEVRFHPKEPECFDLNDKDSSAIFATFLTESSHALTLRKAECFLSDERLQHLNFLDTAGLCSPVGFHKDVTEELLKRRPDKILVLLDSRRIDCNTNRTALDVLKKFISVPDDYRQVTFALTFWDHAIKNFMIEDSPIELDYSSEKARKDASRILANEKRKDVTKLLYDAVHVRCDREPMIFTLGLGEAAPAEMADALRYLWKHLESDCRGWVGVEMWANRWRGSEKFGARLLDIYFIELEQVKSAECRANDDSDLSGEDERIQLQRKQVKNAASRAIASVKDVITSQRQLMLAEISSLDSKSGLIDYMKSGYTKSSTHALDVLEKETESQIGVITESYGAGKDLQPISLDRKIIGLDENARLKAMDEITGVMYGLKSVWDFLLGGVKELNKNNRENAREILREQVRSMMDLFSHATDKWVKTVQRLQKQADEFFLEKQQEVGLGREGRKKTAEKHRKKRQFLEFNKPHLDRIQAEISSFVQELQSALQRIATNRDLVCSVRILTDVGEILLKKGRENDVYYTNGIIGNKWFAVEIGDRENSHKYFINENRCRGRSLYFDVGNTTKSGFICPPSHASAFEIRLSSLEGFFFSKKKGI